LFNVNPGELVVLAVLFLLVFGPERIPEIAVQLGRLYRQVKQATEEAGSEFTRELEAAARASHQEEVDRVIGRATAGGSGRPATASPANDVPGPRPERPDRDLADPEQPNLTPASPGPDPRGAAAEERGEAPPAGSVEA
jgi:sec-independent protein translocase protein TatB